MFLFHGCRTVFKLIIFRSHPLAIAKKVYRHYKVSYLSSLFTLSLPRPFLTIFLKVFALQLCFTSLEGNSPFCAYIGPQWRRRVLHAKSVISAVVFLLIFRFERHPKKVNENKWRKMGSSLSDFVLL